MSYELIEKERKMNITDARQFRNVVCSTCRWREICREWEFRCGTTLYMRAKISFDGKVKGVYRCASYEPKHDNNHLGNEVR